MRRILTAAALAGALLLPASPRAHAQVPEEGKPLFTPFFPAEEFAARRARLFEAMGDSAIAVFQGAPAAWARFRQDNQFFYLCGVEAPHAYLLLDGRTRRTTLYLLPRNERRAGTDGNTLTADDSVRAQGLVGVDAVRLVERLQDDLAGVAAGGVRAVYTLFTPGEGLSESRDGATRTRADIADDPWDGRAGREAQFVRLLEERFPTFRVRDLSPVVDEMRLIKSPRELDLIRRATRLSAEAILESMRSTEPGVAERELDGLGRLIFTRNGAQGDAYAAIVSGGVNATYPHHRAAGKHLRDGELVLMDYAPDVGYYRSDVTRIWPVNGRFEGWQRELYGFYLTCYQAVLRHIRPGVTAQTVIAEATAEMEAALAGATFSKPIYRAAAERFVAGYRAAAASPNASLGHWVGMATHDPGPRGGLLRPGMVFTIEPALRVPEEHVYIRNEDLLIITETGVENASAFLPLEMDAIERVIAEPGLLQRYPRSEAYTRVQPQAP